MTGPSESYLRRVSCVSPVRLARVADGRVNLSRFMSGPGTDGRPRGLFRFLSYSTLGSCDSNDLQDTARSLWSA